MPHTVRKFIKNSSLTLMSLIFSGLIIIGGAYAYVAVNLPDVRQLRDIHLQVPLEVYTSDGKLIAEFGDKKRIPVSINQVPKQLIQAILATEDQRYYEHSGVDFIGMVRAAKAVISSGKKVQGASTITMQVARNFFFSPEKTYTRKINEVLLAFKIDHSFSKNEVLELYLNKIFLGQRAYGVAAAAQTYFGKPLQQLTLPEMALIAGLPQAPTRYNPLINPVIAKERRNHVLARMYEANEISKADYEAAIRAPLDVSYHETAGEIEAPYLAEMVRNAMYAQLGDEAYEGGYKVYTTINSALQREASSSLKNGLLGYEERHGYRGAEKHLNLSKIGSDLSDLTEKLEDFPTIGNLIPGIVLSISDSGINTLLKNGSSITISSKGFSWARQAPNMLRTGDVIRVRKTAEGEWRLAQLPKIQGALVSLNNKNGEILALEGGFSYAQSSFNRAIQADRQAGSSFKPFIFSAALDKGYTLASIINDAPIVMNIPGTKEAWRPQNDTQEFYGPTTLRVGLIKSRNVVSVRLLQAIGVPYAVDYAKRFGFTSEEIPATPSLALGTTNISPLKITAGYATFANGGYKITPFFINSIVDRNGKTIFKAQPAVVPSSGLSGPAAPQVISPQNAYLITSALKDVIYTGTGTKALVLKRSDLAGKTGTTNDQVDAWFCGYNSDLVTTVWVGYDQPQSIYEHGAQAALPIWIDFMADALAGKPEKSLPQPPGITAVRIDPRTGLLARPGESDAIFEVFANDTVPKTETSDNAVSGASNTANAGASGSNSDDSDTEVKPLF